MRKLDTPEEALALLASLGASAWLVQHHRLVVEAAEELCAGVRYPFDRSLVLLGAALHDTGKVMHPSEMSSPGHAHEKAGRQLLLSHGVEPAVARFCETHADWHEPTVTVEDLLVGYPASSSVSVNEQALHAIPSDNLRLANGDMVTIQL